VNSDDTRIDMGCMGLLGIRKVWHDRYELA
jgi:hypothetical protein